MPRLIAAIATMLAVVMIAPAGPAAADGYGSPVPTQTTVTVNPEFNVGEDVVLTYEVTANSEAEGPIEGTLDVTIDGGAGAGQSILVSLAIDESHAYNGAPVTSNIGPQALGAYSVTAVFTPKADSNYLGSTGNGAFNVVAAPAPPDANTPDNNVPAGGPGDSPGGFLPNTGGPALWWLLLAVVLVGGGAGAVYYSRRSTATA